MSKYSEKKKTELAAYRKKISGRGNEASYSEKKKAELTAYRKKIALHGKGTVTSQAVKKSPAKKKRVSVPYGETTKSRWTGLGRLTHELGRQQKKR